MTKAEISPPTPNIGQPSSTVTSLLVFFTLSTIQSLSKGLIVLKLITSALIPYFSNNLAASKQTSTIRA